MTNPAHPLTVVVDADALIAQTNPADALHHQASQISQFLIANHASVLYPASAILEAATHIQRVLNSPQIAYSLTRLLTNPVASVVEIDKSIVTSALQFFNPSSSKRNTLFDCTVAAVARHHTADAIFSFDKFYTSLGFRLTSSLL